MPIAAGLLFATWLASGSPATAPVDVLGAAATAPQSQEDPRPAPASTSETPPHQIGLGGFGGSGGGPSFRYFFGERVGFDLTAGWYRPGGGRGSSLGTSFQVAPSVLVMLTKFQKSADVNLRPYVGGGINYARIGTPIQTTTTVAPQSGGVGMQVFGGAEITFASASSIAISAEVRYNRLAIAQTSFSPNLDRGTNVYLLFHYYMK